MREVSLLLQQSHELLGRGRNRAPTTRQRNNSPWVQFSEPMSVTLITISYQKMGFFHEQGQMLCGYPIEEDD